MNIARLTALQDHLKSEALWQGKVGFNMISVTNLPHPIVRVGTARSWINGEMPWITQTCQTTACMAGLACLMFGEPKDQISDTTAQRLLGLTNDDAARLFYNMDGFIANDAWGMNGDHDRHGMGYGPVERDLGEITHGEAILAIDRLIAGRK